MPEITKTEKQKSLIVWFAVLSVLYIKSTLVLCSLYSTHQAILACSVYALIPILFLTSFTFMFSPKKGVIYLFCLDFLISVLFMADIVYARAFGHLISFFMLFAKNVTGDLGASTISLIRWTDFLLFLDLPLLFVVAVKSNYQGREKKRICLFWFTAVLSAALMYFQFGQLGNAKLLGNYKFQPLLMSPLGNHMFDFYRFIYERGHALTPAEKEGIRTWLADNRKYQEPGQDYTGLEGLIKGKNIIVIQFESLENIMIGQSYHGQEITPKINRLLGSSIYFSHIIEQVRDGNSSDAELLYNASVYPLHRGSAFLRFGESSYVTLPKLLHARGYVSMAIHGDDRKFWNRDRAFPALGFDNYIAEEQFEDKSKIGMGISDQSLFKQALKEIKKLPTPFNVFIITLTSHMPFTLDKQNQDLTLPQDNMESSYLQSIHYTDKALGEFYDRLQAEGLLENTVLIIYGDHEGIHKYYKTTLPDNNYEIPFIIHIPGMRGFEAAKIGGQIDMMPTVAYLLGVEKEKYASAVMGRNLFGQNSGSAILPTGEVISGTDDAEHLQKAFEVADLCIRGNYFAAPDNSM